MGRRYYCEYCEKTFIDELKARRKHLQSAQHIKLRNSHYENNRDLRVLLEEESAKQWCRKFFQTGFCVFLSNCKYSHYSHEELLDIKKQVEEAEIRKKLQEKTLVEVPSVESWLRKYHERHEDKNANTHMFWNYPEQLENRNDLPPSLKKFKPRDFHYGSFDEWG